MTERSVFEFLIHYLADETLRNDVFAADMKGLTDWGLSGDDAQLLIDLEEQPIFDRIAENLAGQGASEIAEALKVLLKEVGFNAKRAQKEIWDSEPDCTPTAAPARGPRDRRKAIALASAAGASAYAQGEVHVRRMTPKEVQVERTARLEFRGQGFGHGASVEFRITVTKKDEEGNYVTVDLVEPGYIVARYADIDVHQYLSVEALFPEIGDWSVWVWNDFIDDWKETGCVVRVFA